MVLSPCLYRRILKSAIFCFEIPVCWVAYFPRYRSNILGGRVICMLFTLQEGALKWGSKVV